MLSGPRHLLSALALGMFVLGLLLGICWSCFSFVSFLIRSLSGFLVSFVLPLGFGFIVSLGMILCPLGLLA